MMTEAEMLAEIHKIFPELTARQANVVLHPTFHTINALNASLPRDVADRLQAWIWETISKEAGKRITHRLNDEAE